MAGWLAGWVRLQNRYHDSVRRKTGGRFLCQVNASVGEILGVLGGILNMQLISSNERAHKQEVPRVQQHLLLFIQIDISHCVIKWGSICGRNYFNYKTLAPLKSNKIAFV